jgi:hypothetical protein
MLSWLVSTTVAPKAYIRGRVLLVHLTAEMETSYYCVYSNFLYHVKNIII